MNQTDEKFLRTAFQVAKEAREKGNAAFGAVLADENGNELLRAGNTTDDDDDPTAHAEMNLLRKTFGKYDPDLLKNYTLYASAEPCVMCAGAIYWCGIGRVVFGMSVHRQAELTPENKDTAPLIECREVIGKGSRDFLKVEGPWLEDEAEQLFTDVNSRS